MVTEGIRPELQSSTEADDPGLRTLQLNGQLPEPMHLFLPFPAEQKG